MTFLFVRFLLEGETIVMMPAQTFDTGGDEGNDDFGGGNSNIFGVS